MSTMLWDIFLSHDGRTVHKWKHYFPIYEQYFSRFVNRPVFLLEIGVSEGGSLEMWKKYFGPHAQIVGIDIDSRWAFEDDQIAVRIGSQSDTSFLTEVIREFGVPDIVLDDGSHEMTDVLETFSFLYPQMRSGSVYFVEDMHASYWEEFGGGLRMPGTFVEHAKNLVDELNAEWTRGALEPSEFTRSTLSISFFDSCVVFDKGRTSAKNAPKMGGKVPPKSTTTARVSRIRKA